MRFMIVMMFLLLWPVVGAAHAQSLKLALDQYHCPVTFHIEHWQTKNKADVYFVHLSHLPMVDVEVLWFAGSAYDKQHFGLGYLVNQLLDEGSVQHDAIHIAQVFDQVGAVYTHAVGRDSAMLGLRSMTDPSYLKPALAMFHEVLSKPAFSSQSLNRVKHQIVAKIRYQQQLPKSVAHKAFYQALYGSHPYAHPIIGDLAAIPALSAAMVRRFYQQYYVSRNAKIMIVGDVTREQAVEIADQLVTGLPEGERAARVPRAKASATFVRQINFPSQQNTLLVGNVGLLPNDPYYLDFMVGNQILGGLPLSSILFDVVRNQHGLVYHVSSRLTPLRAGGPFYVYLQTRHAKAKQARQLVDQVLQHFVKQGATASQLLAGKKNVLSHFPMMLSSNTRILNNVDYLALYDLPLDFFKTYCDRIRAVNSERVKHIWQQFVDPQKMGSVVVGQP